MTKYERAIYRHILTLGDVGEEVTTDIHPWLRSKYHMSAETARLVRDKAMRTLKTLGYVFRAGQGHKLIILK